MQPPEFEKVQVPLFKRIALCIRSPHFQVAERSLFIWNNDDIVKLINTNRNVLFPIVIGALYSNSKQHWNGTVHGLTYNVLKLLMEADPMLFDECSARHRADDDRDASAQAERDKTWSRLMTNFNENASESLKYVAAQQRPAMGPPLQKDIPKFDVETINNRRASIGPTIGRTTG